MTSTIPRSWLFVPGSRPDRIAKALASGADAIVIDWEDAVAASDKVEARRATLALLAGLAAPAGTIAVRINTLHQAIGLEDLAALARQGAADWIVVPKVEEPAELALAAAVLADASAPGRLVALIESAQGIARAAAVARATPRLAALMFGAADYAADLGQRVGRFDPGFARATVVNAAAAGGCAAIDSPFFDLTSEALLTEECGRARAAGFHGKAAIHPAHLGAIRAAFAPTEEERALARRILAAAPAGVGVVDGRMIDAAMERWARRVDGRGGATD